MTNHVITRIKRRGQSRRRSFHHPNTNPEGVADHYARCITNCWPSSWARMVGAGMTIFGVSATGQKNQT